MLVGKEEQGHVVACATVTEGDGSGGAEARCAACPEAALLDLAMHSGALVHTISAAPAHAPSSRHAVTCSVDLLSVPSTNQVMGAGLSSSNKVVPQANAADLAIRAGVFASKEAMDSVVSTMSDVQLEEFKEAFNAFDADGGGSIDREELAALFRSLGRAQTEEEMDRLMQAADADGSGRYTWVANLDP